MISISGKRVCVLISAISVVLLLFVYVPDILKSSEPNFILVFSIFFISFFFAICAIYLEAKEEQQFQKQFQQIQEDIERLKGAVYRSATETRAEEAADEENVRCLDKMMA